MNTIAHTRVLMNPTDMHRFHKLLVICSFNGFLFLGPLAVFIDFAHNIRVALIVYVCEYEREPTTVIKFC